MNFEIAMTAFVFIMTMAVIFWRPKGIHEAWPASVGAIIILVTGIVTRHDLYDIITKIGGASITIIATIVMAVILESFGFFHWSAARLVTLAKGSSYRLYWYIQLLCFLMTLLFNNDGSILITTPILIILLKNLRLKPHQQIPYLLSGALIATASSAPIGVSNIVNLIGLKIVHMPLYMQPLMMFVPTMLGLLFMSLMMYFVLKSKFPEVLPASTNDIEESFFIKNFHPLKSKISVETKRKRTKFMLKILTFVFVMRCLLFVASFISIPIEIVAVLGSLILLIWRWYHLRTNPVDILKKTPWQILLFAFSMYVIIYGLHNAGLTDFIVKEIEPIVNQGLFNATLAMGGLVSVLSNLFNNHPALMIGTISLTEMGLDPVTLKAIYLANIVGSDIGSLLLPIGTLASLIWMHILKENKIKVKWKDYLSVTIIVIPLTTIISLILLFYWIQLFFS
ncbi:arsenic transporter [Gottfriedia acidiceleris]|uniref:arsenic transporter n=1 Tax=Bacillaceae TaxID=186817 RepID=UPI000BEB56DC|nr:MULTISPECIES: arsenic transporter [unclassified Bacillus (in: firmicutes)]PEC49985.1 arsenic transporter [Bacillus sp. AFS096315]PFM79342.1 arsenic transporter [Bacillus sp. AFS077874]